MPKLYRSTLHYLSWIAYTPATGWVMFPAVPNGWEKRQPCRGLDPLYLREVPARQAFHTGFPERIEHHALVRVA